MLFSTASQLCFRICHQEGLGRRGAGNEWTHQPLVYANINLLGDNINTVKTNKETVLDVR
jgi:hypothetical protein